ncbi:hypothetical protein JDY09_06980 [Thermoleophilum album]|uniref:hypothetical protein n=1 Tax=Thermoleophilum album TaxID=29539 RepID=UPI00237CB03E|nr:hypothetical protein [Thermoleophilum album]WDT93129.1 hypothetical protein JDY09_06980 [Thermoleophilum album]
MAWTESYSASFSARHERAETDSAQRTLDDLERFRLELAELGFRTPGEIAIVFHPNELSLLAAQPALAAWRAAQTRHARRYLAGWAASGELHLLAAPALRRRAAATPLSERALRATARRLYVQAAAAASGWPLPPPLTATSGGALRRLGWLFEGPAAVLAGQSDGLLAALASRLRDGPFDALPPSTRDAYLGGFALCATLEEQRGRAAVASLVLAACRSEPRGRGEHLVARAFSRPLGEVRRLVARFLDELPRRLARLER